jgi:GLPGLI family protein
MTIIMRKYLPHTLFLTALFVSISGSLMAQQTISDAKIVYKMDLPAEQLQTDGRLQGSTLTQYMHGHLSRIDMNFNVVKYTYLINSKESSMVTLIEQNGDKYLIRVNKTQYDKDLKHYEGIRFKEETGTKLVAGYTCKRAIGTMSDGKTFEVYYTPQLIPENKQYNRRFINLKGLPLEFEILTKTGAKMRVTATKVDLYPIPASYFDVPKSGYKEVSQEEVERM